MLSYIYAGTTRQTTRRDRPSFRKHEAKTHESLIQMIRSPGRRKGGRKPKIKASSSGLKKCAGSRVWGKAGRQWFWQGGRKAASPAKGT